MYLKPLHRRTFLLGGCAATLALTLGRAQAATPFDDRKLVVVILRGAMDGLAALPKLDDPDIHAHRAQLIDPNARPLAQGFALHSAFSNLESLYRAGEAGFIPAVSGPYRERSHFAAQDLLECGHTTTVGEDGWLNRALQTAPQAYSAVSIGAILPLVLRGPSRATSSWSPPVQPEASDDTLARLIDLYQGDDLLAPSLVAAVKAGQVASGMDGMGGGRARGGAAPYTQLMTAAGKFLAADGGPEIAVVSMEGWDTHASQNLTLNQRFAALDGSIVALRDALGPAWKKTAMIAVTEFGRTVRVNGARGTDHGTGGLAILAGGALKGGHLWGDWPGLAPTQLFEDRDLAPTLDIRAAFKGLLRDHLGWDVNALENEVFPDSASTKQLTGLV